MRLISMGKFQTRRPSPPGALLLTCTGVATVSMHACPHLREPLLLAGSDHPVLAVDPEEAAVEVVVVRELPLLHLATLT